MKLMQEEFISENASPSEIVKSNYRTATVFQKYGIDFCCGGKWPLSVICESKEIQPDLLIEELKYSSKTIAISPLLTFNEWRLEFLTEFIINVHHNYLQTVLPVIAGQLKKFADGHRQKFPWLTEAEARFTSLTKTILPHIRHEEEIVFPYVRQIAHAYDSKEPYAGLLVRTLRKPLENIIQHEHDSFQTILVRLRELTDNYTAPVNACTSHRVTFSMLHELDNDLAQHFYLENEILFPRAIAREKELLERKDD